MKCPHCATSFHSHPVSIDVVNYPQAQGGDSGVWKALHEICPACSRPIIEVTLTHGPTRKLAVLVHPLGRSRPVPTEIDKPYSTDFIEACNVLPHSPKASAALSRRNLQAILRDKAGTKAKDLYDQIEEVIKSGTVPSHIAEELHAVRNIGNFAAHTIKSTNTGEILDVETGEAEWNLDVIESLFDFYFVQPAISAKRKSELNKKLKEAGKPEIP